jgi:glycosyltransferase involved in cell wall biosynthesis
MKTDLKQRARTTPGVDLPTAKIVLSAFGIHAGGGRVLLEALILSIGEKLRWGELDCRFGPTGTASAAIEHASVRFVRRAWIARVCSSIRSSRVADSQDILLSFNSLPPLIRSRARSITFVHAPHFVGADRGIRYAPITRLRIVIEKAWMRVFLRNTDEIWVQTKSMARAFKERYKVANVKVVPLVDKVLADKLAREAIEIKKSNVSAERFSFFYPADAVGHKNHQALLSSWIRLSEESLRPELWLTLTTEELAVLRRDLPDLEEKGVRLVNLGRIEREAVLDKLKKCSALIFPSLAETFGIPLLEARALGVPIVASERSFVRDVCTPVATFDPLTPDSITEAVKRFICGGSDAETEFFDPERFVELVVSRRLVGTSDLVSGTTSTSKGE